MDGNMMVLYGIGLIQPQKKEREDSLHKELMAQEQHRLILVMEVHLQSLSQ